MVKTLLIIVSKMLSSISFWKNSSKDSILQTLQNSLESLNSAAPEQAQGDYGQETANVNRCIADKGNRDKELVKEHLNYLINIIVRFVEDFLVNRNDAVLQGVKLPDNFIDSKSKFSGNLPEETTLPNCEDRSEETTPPNSEYHSSVLETTPPNSEYHLNASETTPPNKCIEVKSCTSVTVVPYSLGVVESKQPQMIRLVAKNSVIPVAVRLGSKRSTEHSHTSKLSKRHSSQLYRNYEKVMSFAGSTECKGSCGICKEKHFKFSTIQSWREETCSVIPPIAGASSQSYFRPSSITLHHPTLSPLDPSPKRCKVLLSNVPEVFSVGDRVPCPSGVVQRRGQERGFPLYYHQQAFSVVQTTTPLSQLRKWSALHHGNVLMLSAVLGECDNHPGTCYQLTPVVTGDLQHLMERRNLPSLIECLSSLSSDRADLVLWNVKYILREILKGLDYLHSKEVKIVHGDLKLHNILIDIVCNCDDIFQCPHEGESGYRVYISDFDKAAHIGEGGATEVDDVYSFGALLKRVFGISKVDECTSVERECVGLEGLRDVVMACFELDPDLITTASDLLKYPFFSLHPPPSALPRAVLPLSSEEEDSPPLAVQAQQQPDEDCKQVLGFKTPEKIPHLLASKHSPLNDLSTPDQPASADEIPPHQPTSKPTTSSPAVSAASGGKDSDQSCEQLIDVRTPAEQPCFNSARSSKNINCPSGGLELKAVPCNGTTNIEKTEETPACPLATKHSQYNPDESDLTDVMDRNTPSNTTPSTPSPAANTSEDRNEVRPGDIDDCQKRSMFPNNSTEEREEVMAHLFKEQRAREGNVISVQLGSVVFTQCRLFAPGEMVPLPSKAAMSAFIGKGGNGVVSYVYHKRKEFAVKETCLREDELFTLRKLSHRNVMEISAVIKGERHERYHGGRTCYQLMPRVTGDVKKLMDNRGLPTLCHYFFKFKTESDKASYVLGNVKFILREVLSGLQYLHQTGIVHRDVKLQNILIDIVCNCEDIFQCPHEGESGYRVYISDFDSAMDVERTRRRLDDRAQRRYPLRYSVHGTPGYRAPEACYWCSSNKVISSYLSPSQDIWSFGCTLMKFFVGSSGPSSQKEMSSVKLSHCLQHPPPCVQGVQNVVDPQMVADSLIVADSHEPTRQTQANLVKDSDKGTKKVSRLRQLTVDNNEMKKLLKVSLLEKYFPLATDLHDLAQSCLQVDPTQRPTVEEILKHPFFKVSNSSSS